MRVVISAAGTGGHINPGIAIANKIKEKQPDSEIVFIGTNRGLENDLVPRAGYGLRTIDAYGFKKEISLSNFLHIISTLKSRKEVKKIFDEFKPDVVIGTGGYICGPVFSVATSRKIPCVLHESNAYPGMAVKMFSKKADRILLGFEETKSRLKGCKKAVWTGTPTKIKKIDVQYIKKYDILKELGIKTDLPIVLVSGGSQGAQRINEAMIDLILNHKSDKYQIIWATGAKQFDIVKEEFEKNGKRIANIKNVKMLPYIYNMEELMNIADLIVSRSGAMSITEISIVGKPAIFIPLPSRSANRQIDNALVLKKIGAAKIIKNEEVNGENLSKEIDDIIEDKKELEEMGRFANTIAPRDVEDKIYQEIVDCIEERKYR